MNRIYLLVKNNIGATSTIPPSMIGASAYVPSVTQIRTLLNDLVEATGADDEVISQTMHLMGRLASQHQFTLKSWRRSLIACFYVSVKMFDDEEAEEQLDTDSVVSTLTRIPKEDLHKMEADVMSVLDFQLDCEQDSEF